MQMTFERFGRSVTLPALPEDFANAVAAAPLATQYLVDYGWKQSLSDSFAGAKNAEEFEGKLRKRFDSIIAGTVRTAGTGTARVKRNSLEAEIFRLASSFIDGAIKRKNFKVTKERRIELIAEYSTKHLDELTLTAEDNLEKVAALATESSDSLDELFAEIPTG